MFEDGHTMAQTGQLHRDGKSDSVGDVAAAADAVDHRLRLRG